MLSRREFTRGTVVTLALTACHHEDKGEDVAPGEDLMREHGVLERLMLIYDAAAHRLDSGDRSVRDAVHRAAVIARDFVESYHEIIEEQYVFPRCEHRLPELVRVLRAQHDAGRGLTDRILAAPDAAALRGYVTMFRPHVAREDTLLFPAFHDIAGKEYDALGDKFEDEETKRFGRNGFEHFVALLPPIEAAVGVDDLAKFTVG